MKATINGLYVLGGNYIGTVKKDWTYFYVPKGECDVEICEAVMDGSINEIRSCGDTWQLQVNSELIEWGADDV